MEKDQKIFILLIILVFLVALSIGVYLLAKKKDVISDSLKFQKEYEIYNDKTYDNGKDKYLEVNIGKDNLYVYKTDEEIVDILKNQSGVIYFGFATCPYCRSMVSLLNDVASQNDIEKIYYVDISNIRDSYEVSNKTVVKITNGTSNYYKILELLDDNLLPYIITDNEDNEYNTGVKRLYAPTVVVVKNGKILGFYEGTVEDAEYNSSLTEEQTKELTDVYVDMFKELNEDVCTKESCKN